MIDADLHNSVPKAEALFPYLAPVWVEYIQQSAFKGPADNYYPKGTPTVADVTALPLEGVEIGILNCLYAVDSIHNPDSAMAMARAVNDWQAAEWLAKEPRLRASVVVPSQNPTMAAQEIRRVAGQKGFVQVLLPARTRVPLGDRLFRPVFEAAVEGNLVVGIHFGGAPGNPPTPTGWPATYVEEYVAMAQVARAQVASLVDSGLFADLPALRVAVIECGWTWMPSLLARSDAELLRERVKLTLTPTHPPPRPGILAELVDQMGAQMLMYASDHPHAHAEEARQILAELSPDSARQIESENARSLYGIDRPI